MKIVKVLASNILDEIYQAFKEGEPVRFGAILKHIGSSHFKLGPTDFGKLREIHIARKDFDTKENEISFLVCTIYFLNNSIDLNAEDMDDYFYFLRESSDNFIKHAVSNKFYQALKIANLFRPIVSRHLREIPIDILKNLSANSQVLTMSTFEEENTTLSIHPRTMAFVEQEVIARPKESEIFPSLMLMGIIEHFFPEEKFIPEGSFMPNGDEPPAALSQLLMLSEQLVRLDSAGCHLGMKALDNLLVSLTLERLSQVSNYVCNEQSLTLERGACALINLTVGQDIPKLKITSNMYRLPSKSVKWMDREASQVMEKEMEESISRTLSFQSAEARSWYNNFKIMNLLYSVQAHSFLSEERGHDNSRHIKWLAGNCLDQITEATMKKLKHADRTRLIGLLDDDELKRKMLISFKKNRIDVLEESLGI